MIKIHHLNCVEILSPIGARAIGHCLLLEWPHRLVLIDTGIGLQDVAYPQERLGNDLIKNVGFRLNESDTAFRQIEKLGLCPELVTDCIISHLDNDHIGGLADFPHATVHVSQEELDQFKAGNQRYLSTPLSHQPKILTYPSANDRWYGFEARKVEVENDCTIYLIPLFGHTMGHCGVAIQVNGEWLFYVGDAYYLRAELTDENHPVNALAKMRADNELWRVKTLQRIREFVREHPDITCFGYHDPEEFFMD